MTADTAARYRSVRLEHLLQSRNADGGWGYRPKGQSWLEPTCLAMLSLTASGADSTLARGWNLLRSWQLPEGGYRPAAAVGQASWATSLCVTLHCVHQRIDPGVKKAIGWLVGTRGSEGFFLERALSVIKRLPVEYDPRWKGWPWSPEATSWVEPTSHALVALKKVMDLAPAPEIAQRIEEGERMIADRRCSDGGWNHGNRRVFETDLKSYPETTAVALLGLQGAQGIELGPSLEAAKRFYQETGSRLARAWLSIALRTHSVPVEMEDAPVPPDLAVVALEALAAAEGDKQWLRIA